MASVLSPTRSTEKNTPPAANSGAKEPFVQGPEFANYVCSSILLVLLFSFQFVKIVQTNGL
jgi:hypothetical protein